ncbi:unnamed protein product [Heligmosomoides polygyrus]|uniref:Reverse transcriptase domain-containing protein n=1 Tax=Heligmosomoides polygyrus TaxID=6339 RepID=A0A183FWB3_HELPZ|nr:unnamed protein product [Heligmosomoides polygyrus]
MRTKQDFGADSARSTTHTITKLIEVSREYTLLPCLTFIDLKKAYVSVETETVIDALLTQAFLLSTSDSFESCTG